MHKIHRLQHSQLNTFFNLFYFSVLAISVLDDQSLDNLQLDPSFPLKLRQTQFGPILNQIKLPKEALQENAYRGLIKSVFFEYKTLHNLLLSADKYVLREGIEDYVVNSRVVSASISQGRHIQLPQKAIMTFTHLTPNLTDPICVFWNFELSGWSDTGCHVSKTNATETTCECDHLTNFAVLMRPGHVTSAKLGPTTVFVLEIVTYVAVALSVVFIFIILYKVRHIDLPFCLEGHFLPNNSKPFVSIQVSTKALLSFFFLCKSESEKNGTAGQKFVVLFCVMIWKMKMAAKSSFVLLWGKTSSPVEPYFNFNLSCFPLFLKNGTSKPQ